MELLNLRSKVAWMEGFLKGAFEILPLRLRSIENSLLLKGGPMMKSKSKAKSKVAKKSAKKTTKKTTKKY